ncbi:hypothetical protein TrLO_g1766 [Triparma laevis f. longispina]|uniref:Uncharacterized protein n=1 Tax=Triparma laevis f. longispina TaxID=1714387 RepID=A0A9W7F1I0_9STRA|nr:hypothetical protein TrLO_g1766 [Triparma laevis f. longispina]
MSSPNTKSKYGAASMQINRNIKNGKAGNLPNNQAVRNYAHSVYEARGMSDAEIQRHMDNKDAGHIRSQHNGGQNCASNYMWEDRHDNRAHGDDRVRASAEKRAGRR